MQSYISLKFEGAFHIHGRGLLLIPILDLPKVSGFQAFDGNVEVLLPDGKKTKYSARFLLEHFNLNHRIAQWKIVILLPNATKTDIPEGSEIVVTEDIASRLEHK